VLLRGAALGNQKTISRDAQAGMVVVAAPVAALIVVEPGLLLQFFVVPLDPPAPLGRADQNLGRGFGRQRRQPVSGVPSPNPRNF